MPDRAGFAASIVRRARSRAGLTQSQLAAKAGITQSVISAYESGRRQPTLPTLASLVEAAGFDLTIGLRRSADPLYRLTGPLGRRVRRNRDALAAAVRAHGAANLRVFGSVARGEERPGSDIDFLVDLPSEMGLFGLGRLRTDLETIVGAPVDVVPATDVKPDIRTRVAGDLIPV